MAANLKGLSGIKGLALRHGEKIVIALFGLLALYFVYSSIQLPSLEPMYEAEELQKKVTQARAAVTDSKWPEPGSDAAAEVRTFPGLSKSEGVKVETDDYRIGGFNPPVMPPSLLRTDPPILNAENVKATGGSGLLAYRDENTLAEQERKRALEEEERTRKAEEEAQKAADEAARGGDRGGRNQGEGMETDRGVFDPEHPERRMVEGGIAPAGVPLQGGERLDRGYWAIVTANVPIRKQLELFQDAFQEARGGYDPNRDFPRYIGFEVQRAEVVPGKDLAWQRVAVTDGQTKTKPLGYYVNDSIVNKLMQLASTEWAGPAIEPVDPRWTDPMLTMPVPPLVGRDFGEEATHPAIPLAINAPPEEMEVPQETIQPDQEQPIDAEAGFTASGAAPGQLPGGAGISEFRGPAGASRFGGGGMGFRGGMRGEFSEAGPGMRMGMGEMGGAVGGIATGQRTTLPSVVNDLLLRFFDFTVEPGRKYKYRVRVVVADPNYGISKTAGMLDSAVIDRQAKEAAAAKAKGRTAPFFRTAEEWSEPSATVGIPMGGLVHLAGAEQPSGKINGEPTVTMIAEAFDVDPAENSVIHVGIEEEYQRGAVINLNEKKVKYAGENDTWTDTKESFKLYTGLTLLDVKGGEQLAKDVAKPARVIVMDTAGGLMVRDELSDSIDVRYLRLLFDESKRRNRQDAMQGGEFGGFEGGRGVPRGGRPR